jgi:excinuclease ABC subunit A
MGGGLTLADFYQLPIRDGLQFIERLAEKKQFRPNEPLGLVLQEVRSRLSYLNEVGLGYLTLDRPTRTLSGGETERVNLTTCLGTRLVNTLFVLDEPSVGLHPRDTDRLVRLLEHLRDAGNTVVVVEHEPSVMRAANQIVDLGPGHGATGGQVVFQGTYGQILKSAQSLTGQYLSGCKHIEVPTRRNVGLRLRFPHPAPSPQPSPPRRGRGRGPSDSPGRGGLPLSPSEGERVGVRGPAWGTEGLSPGNRRASDALALNDARAPYGGGPFPGPALRLSHASHHNLKDLTVEIPLGRFVCITGVSGSGKTTLVREVLLPALAARLKADLPGIKASDRLAPEPNGESEDENSAIRNPQSAILSGAEHLGRVVLVDQSILAKTPRSNPAVYIGAFDDIREFFAQSEPAKQRGLNASAFSFNSGQGQCERCRGAGFEKIEMQFLSDVFIRCPDCNGRRYRAHILEVKVQSPKSDKVSSVKCQVSSPTQHATRDTRSGSRLTFHGSRITHYASRPASLSIADLLDSTVDEAIEFLDAFPESLPARRAAGSLRLLQEVGLGYLKLGQPINTLSGGESQRLKLVRHLAEVGSDAVSEKVGEWVSERQPACRASPSPTHPFTRSSPAEKPILFLFDEPTTGLHFDDVRVLLKVFQRLVDAGHSVLVIEHNLEVIKSVDWVIDLGPEAGDQGGWLVAQGTPEDIAQCSESYTGQALRPLLCVCSSRRKEALISGKPAAARQGGRK